MSTLTNSHAAPAAMSDPYAGRMPMAESATTGGADASGMTTADGGVMASAATSSGGGGGSSRHMAMPQLMGAPAYARPPRIVEETPRPLDLDDLPIEAMRSPEDEALLSAVYQPFAGDPPPTLEPSSKGGLRAVASRLFGSGS